MEIIIKVVLCPIRTRESFYGTEIKWFCRHYYYGRSVCTKVLNLALELFNCLYKGFVHLCNLFFGKRGNSVFLFRRKSKCVTRPTYCRLFCHLAERNDLIYFAISISKILDYLLPFAPWNIAVNIGWRYSFGMGKSFEYKTVLNWVNLRNTHEVSDSRTDNATTPNTSTDIIPFTMVEHV